MRTYVHHSHTAGRVHPNHRRTRLLLACAIVGAVVLGACSNDRLAKSSNDTASEAGAKVAAPVPPPADSDQVSTGVVGLAVNERTDQPGPVEVQKTDRPTGSQVVPSALSNRKIIRTAQVTLEVANVPDATVRLRDAVSAAGGFLGSEVATYGIRDQVTLTFRIPVDQFDSVINRLSKFGSVLSTGISSDEVTGQYRDLESRLRSKKLSAERLRQLITQAAKPADILLIEHELSDREAEIESMQGQLNVFGDQTSLSTITLTLVSKGDSVVVAPVKSRTPSFRRAWRKSIDALGDIAQSFAAASGTVLPFVPFLAILLAAMLTLRRRAGRSSKNGRQLPATNEPPPATLVSTSEPAETSTQT